MAQRNRDDEPLRPPVAGHGPPTHSPDGVDLTLIRWTLSMTPAQRLQTLQQYVRNIVRLRDGIRRA